MREAVYNKEQKYTKCKMYNVKKQCARQWPTATLLLHPLLLLLHSTATIMWCIARYNFQGFFIDFLFVIFTFTPLQPLYDALRTIISKRIMHIITATNMMHCLLQFSYILRCITVQYYDTHCHCIHYNLHMMHCNHSIIW